jgi:hypothetical protein
MRTSFALHQTRSKLQWERKRNELQREKQEFVPPSSSSTSSSSSFPPKQQQQQCDSNNETELMMTMMRLRRRNTVEYGDDGDGNGGDVCWSSSSDPYDTLVPGNGVELIPSPSSISSSSSKRMITQDDATPAATAALPSSSSPRDLARRGGGGGVVLRSMSVPTNLPEVANSFMKVVELVTNVEEKHNEDDDDDDDDDNNTNRHRHHHHHNDSSSGNSCTTAACSYGTTGSVYLPFVRMDSSQKSITRSYCEDDCYFLPFDEDIDSTTASKRSHCIIDNDAAATTASDDVAVGQNQPQTHESLEQRQQEEVLRNSKESLPHHHRHHHHLDGSREAAVLASLEEFFLGTTIKSVVVPAPASPISTDKDGDNDVTSTSKTADTTNTSPIAIIQIHSKNYNNTVSSVPHQCSDDGYTTIHRNGSLSSVLEQEGGPTAAAAMTGPGVVGQQQQQNTISSLLVSSLSPSIATTTTTTTTNHHNSHSSPVNNNNNNSFDAGSFGQHHSRALTRRRSSLKKVSSYGKFPSPVAPTEQQARGSCSGDAGREDNDTTPHHPEQSLPPSPSASLLKRTVSFGNMQIREYNIALSDHPSCSYGPPIQLSWDYQEKEVIPVTQYDEDRIKKGRRGGHELLLSFYERHVMLIKQAGYTKREIKETMKEVERVKRERRVTDLFLPAMPLDETMENVVDKVKTYFNLFGTGGGGGGNGNVNTATAVPTNHRYY